MLCFVVILEFHVIKLAIEFDVLVQLTLDIGYGPAAQKVYLPQRRRKV